jgi:hypothetical protein
VLVEKEKKNILPFQAFEKRVVTKLMGLSNLILNPFKFKFFERVNVS